jgi:hypothetical protein
MGGGVIALRWRGGTIHDLLFLVFILLQLDMGGSRGGFRGGSFDRRDDLVCANTTLEQMDRH